jgi:hypothetical protein
LDYDPANEGSEPMIAFLMLAEAAAMPMPAFLSGCWEQQREEGRWTEECWTDPRGGLMIGSGRDGSGDKSITFLNPAHDYPQRVRYVQTAAGLDAEVSLADGSKAERWTYQRTAGSPEK